MYKFLSYFLQHPFIYLSACGVAIAVVWCVVWLIILGMKKYFSDSASKKSNKINTIDRHRYDSIECEITRYRDLASGKCAYIANGVYAGLLLARQNFDSVYYWRLFFALSISTAAMCTLFHLFCEERIVFNQIQRRSIETHLKMSELFRHTWDKEKPYRRSVFVSIIIVELFIWIPISVLFLFHDGALLCK